MIHLKEILLHLSLKLISDQQLFTIHILKRNKTAQTIPESKVYKTDCLVKTKENKSKQKRLRYGSNFQT